jgi:hypothetical protein
MNSSGHVYFLSALRQSAGYIARVYHWDPSGEHVIVDYRSDRVFETEDEAYSDAADWCDENSVEAEIE